MMTFSFFSTAAIFRIPLSEHLQILNLASLAGQVGGTGLQGDTVLCRMRPAEGVLSFWYLKEKGVSVKKVVCSFFFFSAVWVHKMKHNDITKTSSSLLPRSSCSSFTRNDSDLNVCRKTADTASQSSVHGSGEGGRGRRREGQTAHSCAVKDEKNVFEMDNYTQCLISFHREDKSSQ